MTTVLVTGAAGGLGSALVDALLARGDEVVALDRTAIAPERAGMRSCAVDL
ncbi:MAG: dependent epimerase/dehydratase family, partial [Gaiellaceae bacterium]|nr:dependent epimerase/dehydratase family [Gaiellaceae bacterium]